MKFVISIAAALVVSCLVDPTTAAGMADQQKIDQQKKDLAPLAREVRQLVRQYYPAATVAVSYDKKRQGAMIHFEYNTLSYMMPDAQGDGKSLVEVRGPYVGGVWCDMILVKGRYNGNVPNVEKGVTQIGPDFYNRLTAPYSKNLDSHMLVVLRYPGGTPPEFLKQFETLANSFDQHLGKPAK